MPACTSFLQIQEAELELGYLLLEERKPLQLPDPNLGVGNLAIQDQENVRTEIVIRLKDRRP